MNEFIMGCQQLSPDMKRVGRLLITNRHASLLAQMTVSLQQPPECKPLGAIVVHTASVILFKQKLDILMPFVNIFNNPAALDVSYKYHFKSSGIYTQVLYLYIHQLSR